ncbi:MAG: hypothetical protein P4L79_02385 [Legionella sp.]|uniref:hypothetical protein n=1 Tax=Legionella sp. TaxID=459 RepID=UPI00284921EE|nr:hypothetical protein [Legionella sp.]
MPLTTLTVEAFSGLNRIHSLSKHTLSIAGRIKQNPIAIYVACTEIGEYVEKNKLDQKFLALLEPIASPSSPSEEAWNDVIRHELSEGVHEVLGFVNICTGLYRFNSFISDLPSTAGATIEMEVDKFKSEFEQANPLIFADLSDGFDTIKTMARLIQAPGEMILPLAEGAAKVSNKIYKVIGDDISPHFISFAKKVQKIHIESEALVPKEWFEYPTSLTLPPGTPLKLAPNDSDDSATMASRTSTAVNLQSRKPNSSRSEVKSRKGMDRRVTQPPYRLDAQLPTTPISPKPIDSESSDSNTVAMPSKSIVLETSKPANISNRTKPLAELESSPTSPNVIEEPNHSAEPSDACIEMNTGSLKNYNMSIAEDISPEIIAIVYGNGLETVEACDHLINVAESNAKVVTRVKEKLEPGEKAAPDKIPTHMMRYAASLATLVYQCHLVHQEKERYSEAQQLLKKELQRSHEYFNFNLELNLNTYRSHALPDLQLDIAQFINHRAYQSMEESHQFFIKLEKDCSTLKQLIAAAEQDKSSYQIKIKEIQKQQQKIVALCGIHFDQLLGGIHSVMSVAASLPTGPIFQSALIMGSALSGILINQERAAANKTMNRELGLINTYSQIAHQYGALLQQSHQDIELYQRALDANFTFISNNSHLFSFDDYYKALQTQLGDTTKKLEDFASYKKELKQEIKTKNSELKAINKQIAKIQKTQQKQKKSKDITSEAVVSELEDSLDHLLGKAAEIQQEIDLLNKKRKNAKNEINNLNNKTLTALREEEARLENIKPIQIWYESYKKRREESLFAGLDENQVNAKKKRLAQGDLNRTIRETEVNFRQPTLQIVDNFFKSGELLLQGLQPLIGTAPQTLFSGLSIAHTVYQTVDMMSFDYLRLVDVLKTQNFSLDLNGFKAVMEVFGGDLGAFELVNAFVNPTLLIAGKLSNFLMNVTGLASSDLKISLEHLYRVSQTLSNQIAEGFRCTGRELQTIKGSLAELVSTGHSQHRTVFLMIEHYNRRNSEQHNDLRSAIDEIKKKNETSFVNDYLIEAQNILARIHKKEATIKSLHSFMSPEQDNLTFHLSSLHHLVKDSTVVIRRYQEPSFTVDFMSTIRISENQHFVHSLHKLLPESVVVPSINLSIYLAAARVINQLLERVKDRSITLNNEQRVELEGLIVIGRTLYDFMTHLKTKVDWLTIIQEKYIATCQILNNQIQKLENPINNVSPKYSIPFNIKECDSLEKEMQDALIGSSKFFWQNMYYSALHSQAEIPASLYARKSFKHTGGQIAFTGLSIGASLIALPAGIVMGVASSIDSLVFYSSVIQQIIQLRHADNYNLLTFISDGKAREFQEKNILFYYSLSKKTLICENTNKSMAEYAEISSPIKLMLPPKEWSPINFENKSEPLIQHINSHPLIVLPPPNQLNLSKLDYDACVKKHIHEYFTVLRKTLATNSSSEENAQMDEIIICPSNDISSQNKLIPLLFSKKYLHSLKEHQSFSLINYGESIGLGSVELRYSLIPNEARTNYQLVLNYSFYVPHIQKNLKVLHLVLATFDNNVVNSFKRLITTQNSYSWEINFNEFLVLAMSGTPAGIGMPAYGTVDINGEGAIAPLELPFVGLSSIFAKLGNQTFCYESNKYDQKAVDSFNEYLVNGDLKLISEFIKDDLIVFHGEEYDLFMTELGNYYHSELLKATQSASYRNARNELNSLYEAVLIGMHLVFKIDLKLAKYLLETINIHDPAKLDFNSDDIIKLPALLKKLFSTLTCVDAAHIPAQRLESTDLARLRKELILLYKNSNDDTWKEIELALNEEERSSTTIAPAVQIKTTSPLIPERRATSTINNRFTMFLPKKDPLATLEGVIQPLGFQISQNISDGNCFYHSVSEQLIIRRALKLSHEMLRSRAVNWIINHEGHDDFIIQRSEETGEDAKNRYIDEHSRPGTWADHNMVQALALALNINMVIIRHNGDVTIVKVHDSIDAIYLGFIPEIHYVSLAGSSPSESLIKKLELAELINVEELNETKLTN